MDEEQREEEKEEEGGGGGGAAGASRHRHESVGNQIRRCVVRTESARRRLSFARCGGAAAWK